MYMYIWKQLLLFVNLFQSLVVSRRDFSIKNSFYIGDPYVMGHFQSCIKLLLADFQQYEYE